MNAIIDWCGHANGFRRGEEFYFMVDFDNETFYFRKNGTSIIEIPEKVFKLLDTERRTCPTCGHIGNKPWQV